MPVADHPDPSSFAGKGTVWLAWDDERNLYGGYWDLEPDGSPLYIEGAPETSSIQVALVWANERANRILIRPRHDPHTYYWAGIGGIPKDLKGSGIEPLETP